MPSARELIELTRKALASLRTESLPEQAALICQEIERIAPDAMAFILRADEQGALRPLAGSGLSARQVQALEGLALDGLCDMAGDAVLADTAGSTGPVRYRCNAGHEAFLGGSGTRRRRPGAGDAGDTVAGCGHAHCAASEPDRYLPPALCVGPGT